VSRPLVVTYSHAYVGGESTLCGDCAEHPPERIPSLGPVQHGARRGICDGCADTTRADAKVQS
jgi:hypothetical protein